jgi:hypothetical protein
MRCESGDGGHDRCEESRSYRGLHARNATVMRPSCGQSPRTRRPLCGRLLAC